jgi:iron complex outermembrane receptor protein
MKRSIVFTAFIAAMFSAYAQNKLKGKVFDAKTNAPLFGATITTPGKGGTTTDNSGSFTIDCGKLNRITVSFIGYETKVIAIKNCDESLNIALNPIDKTLDDVEITTVSAENKSILYQPASITKLTTTELKRGNGLFLDDAINISVPGVTMNRRAVSSGQQFNIRGYGNGSRGTRGINSNFDGQGYKVYLNGISLTDAEGVVVMDDIDFSSIGNVEVVKGPAGTLYGLAIAGVVNLHTIKPEKGKTGIGQDVLIGNYGLQRFTTHFQTATDRSSVLVNYGHQKSDGFTIHNKSHKDFVNVAGEFQPNAKQSIMSYFGYSNSYDERSGELTVAQYNTDDFSGNIEYIKRNGHSKVYTARGGLGHTYNFNNYISNNTIVFLTAFNSNASSAAGWTDKASTNLGVRSSFNTKFIVGSGTTLSGITGVEAQRQNATTVGYGMVKNPRDTASVWQWGNPYYWVIGAITSDLYAEEATTSTFTEWTLALPKDLSITAGIGLSNMKIRLDDRFYVSTQPNKPTHYDTTYKGMVSPHVAINKVFSKEVSVYAAYSRGYKAPVSSYFFIPYVLTPANSETGVVNHHLKPEIGDQFEIGTKGALLKGRLNYQLALFETTFSDKMTTVAVPLNATTTAYTYVVNGGKQDDKGVELALRYAAIQQGDGFFTSVTPFVNFTYSDFKFKNFIFQTGTTVANTKTYDFSGSPVAGVSKIVTSEGIDFATKPGLYGNIAHLYRDKMPITSPDTLTTSGYNLVNAKLGFKKTLSAHWNIDISFGINNITGVKYPIMVFVNQVPDAYIAGPRKANYFAGLKLDFVF